MATDDHRGSDRRGGRPTVTVRGFDRDRALDFEGRAES